MCGARVKICGAPIDSKEEVTTHYTLDKKRSCHIVP
jgi:hypothetical protein